MEKICKFCKQDKSILSNRGFQGHEINCSENPKRREKQSRVCNFCKEEIISNLNKFSIHVSKCKCNPSGQEIREKHRVAQIERFNKN